MSDSPAQAAAASAPKLHVVVMGVSGSGKSTVGKLLARRLHAGFIDADLLHPARNIAKMQAGTPLDDSDREPWLARVGAQLASAEGTPLVAACSALKKSYRDIIRGADPTARFVLLHGSAELLRDRLGRRGSYFMPPSLLQSQLDTLEPIEDDEIGLTLDVAAPPDELAHAAAAWLT